MRLVLLLPLVLLVAGCGGFDRAKWASARGADCTADNPRPTMITAAEHAGMRHGASRATIRALLGAPDSETPTSDGYGLGVEPTGVDCHHMVIEYGSDGAVDTITFVHG